ncbi:hypothetical protein Q4596_09465 [Pseudoalteromonas carrageenovora]|uniref:hypothetical protein n=1 Tax=Pseudoalteromonas carrageenovora TaxID=227 RepID=UPI0026E16A05|nr:hypothetical protein [Pseudoalteromonas carrageenovora]MDO6835852.1 hypothetical protein [Pseudoalteromonas carrageenovora]
MKKIILHVGSGKTGSTSIQKALYECKNENDESLYYPTILNHKGNQIFRFAFCDINDTPSNVKAKYKNDPQGYLAYQNAIKASFKENTHGHDNVIVSSEFLFLSDKSEIESIKSYLVDLGFTEIHVIMYLRDPAKYYLSVAQQALKNHYKLPSPDNFRYDMYDAICNWKLINPQSTILKEFDKRFLHNGDVISDFNQYIQNLGYKFKLKLENAKNESMSVEATVILQDFHRLLELSNLDETEFTNSKLRARRFSNKAAKGTKPVLNVDIADYIYNKKYTEVAKVANEYGIFKELLVVLSKKKKIIARVKLGEVKLFTDIVSEFNLSNYLELLKKL